ncbi:MAG: response regulator [Burkholderiaceae bacterium]|jgi:FixJ family two-component response regulator|nr:response regulator [Burkholderiaceae bacterium]
MNLKPARGLVYIVDDDDAVRDSVQWLLEGQGFRVQSFDSAEAFLARCDLHKTACLLADIRMDGMNGLELQKRLAERESPLPLAFITGHGDVSMAVEAMKKGALDFIQKPFDEIALIQTVERLLAAATANFARQRQNADRETSLATLTHRETQVLERIVAGRLNKQIADDLGISVKTVEAHRANVMKKLGADNVADLLRFVLGSEPS